MKILDTRKENKPTANWPGRGFQAILVDMGDR
jgi:hypothetical protein